VTVPNSDVPVRDAATVVLLRDGAEGIEAWLLTRVTQMAFAAGMTVFPGGRVDDADSALPLAGADLTALAARFDCDETTAHALIGAAVRETFEETGVLLSVPLADLSGARADNLAVDAAALHPWSRWVTPAGEVRRYDTRFFVGALPETAEAQDVTSESSAASWVPVADAMEQAQRGERKMLPPTMTTLATLAPFATVAEAIASARSRRLDAVRPEIRIGDDGTVAVELPDGTRVPIPPSMLP
jgi:8-oxo-dGTP pyrophosphatase MutT (NUDIX family)